MGEVKSLVNLNMTEMCVGLLYCVVYMCSGKWSPEWILVQM